MNNDKEKEFRELLGNLSGDKVNEFYNKLLEESEDFKEFIESRKNTI